MKRAQLVVLLAVLITQVGCYAARVETGLPPSAKVVKKSFAASWIYGLVPPKTVETAVQCPDGVAIVETQLSFVNQLVAGLTLGIYTPMQIVVTCAEKSKTGALDGGPRLNLSQAASSDEIRAVYARAADLAVKTGQPVAIVAVP